MGKIILSVLVVLAVLGNVALGIDRYVPSGGSPSYATILAAIDASSTGDVVIVQNGTFTGTGNVGIYLSKQITVKSAYGPQNCIINGQSSTAITISNNGMFDGFTVINSGTAVLCQQGTVRNCILKDNNSGIGGAIRVYGSSLISNCTIINNHATDGGGIYAEGNSTIKDCIIKENFAYDRGGGVYFKGTNIIINCEITGNRAEAGGIYCDTVSSSMKIQNCIIANDTSSNTGAIYCFQSSPSITNCTIAYNSSAGVKSGTNSSPVITNCIFWENGDDLINTWATYSCIQDGDAGTGNISSDPLFANPSIKDYHLKSQGGRWTGTSWITDAVSSPCIDSGNPSDDYTLEPSPNGGRVNMGAYGGTIYASKAGPTQSLNLIAPVGGETLVGGSNFNLLWGGYIASPDVEIYYSVNNGVEWTMVSPPNIGNTGTYSWLVPAVEATNCLIKICDPCDSNVFSITQQNFEIYKCQITGDINADCHVNFIDLADLASNWLEYAETIIYKNRLSVNPNWVLEGQWEFGIPQGLGGTTYGNPDPNHAFTGENVYGINLAGNYNTATYTPQYLELGPIDCSDYREIKLKFARWLNTDSSNYVKNTIEISNDGINWNIVWTNPSGSAVSDNVWQLLEYNISSYANYQNQVYIRWGQEIVSDRANSYSGWNIDDVEIWGTNDNGL